MECGFKEDSFIQRWCKRRALKKHLKRLAPQLVRAAGKRQHYTPADVKKTAEGCGYPMDYICYAIAAYSSPFDFQTYHSERGEICDYESMRSEIGDVCFGGHTDFTISDALESSSSSSWLPSDIGSGDSNGAGYSDAEGGTDDGSTGD